MASNNMSNLGINISIDDEIINDYRENLVDQYEIAANAIQVLEDNPSDTDAINHVFRALHTVKGNSNLCQLDVLTKFSHAVEEIAVALRQGEIKYSSILGEVILLSLDKTKEISEDLFNNRHIDTEILEKVEQHLNSITKESDRLLTDSAAKIIALIANRTLQTNGMEAYAVDKLAPVEDTEQLSQSGKLTDAEGDALAHFLELGVLLEKKIPYWSGRIERTLPLALGLNKQLGFPEVPAQLTAALYMHDIGFAFFDESFWSSQSKFTPTELKQMQRHPELAANLLFHMPGWEDAKEIVLQHHERWDGAGYPYGIKGDKIRPGAQLLAVVDAFESMTHARPDRQFKRSILRAMTEINNCSGSQFAPHVTSLFNTVVRDTLTHKK